MFMSKPNNNVEPNKLQEIIDVLMIKCDLYRPNNSHKVQPKHPSQVSYETLIQRVVNSPISQLWLILEVQPPSLFIPMDVVVHSHESTYRIRNLSHIGNSSNQGYIHPPYRVKTPSKFDSFPYTCISKCMPYRSFTCIVIQPKHHA